MTAIGRPKTFAISWRRATRMSRCIAPEGTGLTIAEAMALGKPVIATDWSGNTDFADAVEQLSRSLRADHGRTQCRSVSRR